MDVGSHAKKDPKGGWERFLTPIQREKNYQNATEENFAEIYDLILDVLKDAGAPR